ncbi:MAG: GldM family protein [Bacteroidota bacterium]
MTPKISYLLFFLLVPLQFLGQVKIENYSLQKPDTNILYIGIENKIHVSGLKNISQAKILLNGRYYNEEKDGLFYVHSSSSGPGEIQVILSSKIVTSKIFYSKRITEPIALLGNFRDTSLSKNEIVNIDILRVVMPNCILELKLPVINYQITFVSKNKDLNISNKIIGSKIPASLKVLINKLESGDKIKFENIRIGGPDDIPVDNFFITIK